MGLEASGFKNAHVEKNVQTSVYSGSEEPKGGGTAQGSTTKILLWTCIRRNGAFGARSGVFLYLTIDKAFRYVMSYPNLFGYILRVPNGVFQTVCSDSSPQFAREKCSFRGNAWKHQCFGAFWCPLPLRILTTTL